VLWECEIKAANEEQLTTIVDRIVEWLASDTEVLQLPHSRTQLSDQ